jgi:hypothetical protein
LTLWQKYICPVRTDAAVTTTVYLYYGTLTRDLSTLTLHEGQMMRYFGAEEASTLTLAFLHHQHLQQFIREFSA